MVEDLYKEVILDHYKAPRNKRGISAPTCTAKGNNPLCGDEVTVHLQVEDGTIAEAAFEGQGCSISQASASMMTEAVTGRTIDEANGFAKEFRAMMAGEGEPDEDLLGDLVALQGVVRYPARIKCAVLAWDTLQDALESPAGQATGDAPH
jgi:nitrogen fixation protein NifU and related proteins